MRKRIRLPAGSYEAGSCYFVTIDTHDRYRWFSSYPDLADQVARLLGATSEERNTELYAWCLMPDHLHLLAQDANIVEFVRLLKGRATPWARRHEPGRRLWQRSFYDHGLRPEESLVGVAQYIFENPVRAGLVDSPVHYNWSGSQIWPEWRALYRASERAGINPAPTRRNGRG